MLLDAHNHLQDPRLVPHHAQIFEDLRSLGVERAVVNATQQSDWAAVAALARNQPWICPAFGLHPWFVQSRSPDWLAELRALLKIHPQAGIGEIGLDRWIEPNHWADQLEVFTSQLELSTQTQRPLSLHCLKAWGPLWEILRAQTLPQTGFLLHSYGGPSEMIEGFAQRGAYFSFSPYFLHPRKFAQRERFRHVPPERLLVETDAPDMWPPPQENPYPLASAEGQPINHPANLRVAYHALAETLQWPIERLIAQVAENFHRLFGPAR